MNIKLKDSLTQILIRLQPLWRYRVVAFIFLVVALCGYEVLQINNANGVQANSSVASGAPAAPHIDQTVVDQLKQLQDNSVSVKALFSPARDNPFQ